VIAPGSLRLEDGDRVAADPRYQFWVEVKAGAASLMDTGTIAAGLAVPLAGRAWLTAVGGTELTARDFVQVAAADLVLFNRVMLAAIARRVEDEARTSDQLDVTLQAAARREFDGMMHGLAGAASREQNTGATGGDALGSALVEVLKAQNLSDNSLAEARAALAQAPDKGSDVSRAEHLLHNLRLGQRRVILKPGALASDGPPLLLLRQDGRGPAALVSRLIRGWEIRRGAGEADKATELPSGEALQIYPTLPSHALSLRDVLRFGLKGVEPEFGRMAFAAAVVATIALMMPIWSHLLIDKVIPNGRLNMLWSVVIIMIVTSLGGAAFELLKGFALLRLQSRFDGRLQPALVERLLHLPSSFYRQYTVGDIMERVLGLNVARQMVSGPVVTAVLGGIFGLFSLIPLFFFDARLAWIALGVTALTCLVIVGLARAQLKPLRNEMRARGRLQGFVLQLLVGVAKLRAAAAEQRAMAQWTRFFITQRDFFISVQRWQAAQATLMAMLPIIGTVVLFASISYFLTSAATAAGGELPALFTAGDFIAFSTAFTQVMVGLTAMAQALSQTLVVIPLIERARPIVETPIDLPTGAEHPGRLSGAIEFKHVKFRYVADGPPVIDDLHLKIEPGQFVALVGPSGSGKSTIGRLLLGFERPEMGEIFFDGKSADRLDMGEVRRQIGVVLQHGRLSSGPIYENILGGSNLGLDDAWAAARLVGLDPDIEAMPMGMHTVIMDVGSTLTGGQRQRILIARALVQKPHILLLDEATSALDNRTQSIVTETLGKLSTTRIVIAHRLSTIQAVDRIFVIERGKVVETGTYDELLSKEGVFAALVKRQML
jgi:NHLM bacteriocin system ABC transporter ATP-binding protein